MPRKRSEDSNYKQMYIPLYDFEYGYMKKRRYKCKICNETYYDHVFLFSKYCKNCKI